MAKISPRVATALIGIPLVAGIIQLGGWPFRLTCGFLALLGLFELQKGFRRSRDLNGARLVAPFAYPALVAIFVFSPSPALWSSLLVAFLTLGVLLFPTRVRVSLPSLVLTLGALLFVGLFVFLPLLRETNGGRELFWLTILGVWAGDTTAYFAGRAFGKTKLSPLSPKKTREGALAGVVATFLVMLLVGGALQISFGHALIYGVAVAFAAPFGDLAESWWKRELGVKDLGSLLPGHGGILDRCDSLLFSSWAVYWLSIWLQANPS